MMHDIIGLAAIFEKSFCLLKNLDHCDRCLFVFFIILYRRCNNFGLIVFTDHPQVRPRNGNRFSFAAGANCRQQLCKYTNPCTAASHKLQQAAC